MRSPALAHPGTATVTVTVDDQNGATDDETFAWTVVGNTAPILDPVTDQTNDEGDTVPVDIDATDTDTGDILVYSATSLPDGLAIDPATGEITGTITQTAATGSPYSVDLTVDDQKRRHRHHHHRLDHHRRPHRTHPPRPLRLHRRHRHHRRRLRYRRPAGPDHQQPRQRRPGCPVAA